MAELARQVTKSHWYACRLMSNPSSLSPQIELCPEAALVTLHKSSQGGHTLDALVFMDILLPNKELDEWCWVGLCPAPQFKHAFIVVYQCFAQVMSPCWMAQWKKDKTEDLASLASDTEVGNTVTYNWFGIVMGHVGIVMGGVVFSWKFFFFAQY